MILDSLADIIDWGRNMDDSEGQWVNTESFEGGFIREVLIKKRDK